MGNSRHRCQMHPFLRAFSASRCSTLLRHFTSFRVSSATAADFNPLAPRAPGARAEAMILICLYKRMYTYEYNRTYVALRCVCVCARGTYTLLRCTNDRARVRTYTNYNISHRRNGFGENDNMYNACNLYVVRTYCIVLYAHERTFRMYDRAGLAHLRALLACKLV